MHAEQRVCRLCGSPLLQKRILGTPEDADVVWFCKECNQIEIGISEEIYELADEYVEIAQFNYLPDIEENSYAQNRNKRVVCQILEQYKTDWQENNGSV